jgi:hypothetical protein
MAQNDVVIEQPAGWYADPVAVGAARYWDGRGWTDLVAWSGETRHDPTPLRDVERREALAKAAIVSDYLADAVRREVVAPTVADLLRLDVEQRVPGDATAMTTAAGMPSISSAMSTPISTVNPLPHATTPEQARLTRIPSRLSKPSQSIHPTLRPPLSSAVPFAPPRSPVAPPIVERLQALPSEPGRIARWWDDAHRSVRSDIALHGLAYLGVLLLFAGVTGLITFSFGDVAPWVRSLAEVTVPSALFLSAWYLNHRRAVVVTAALTLLGGAILPIIVAASLTDGAPIPPDISGRALPIAQGVAVALIALVMTLVVRRSPASQLRFIAGPAIWMAAGLVAGVARDTIPEGYDTSRPNSFQLAVVLATMTATVLLCSLGRVPQTLSAATRRTALLVSGVVYVLELALASDEDWPLASTIVAGLGALLLVELLSKRLHSLVASGAQFGIVAITAARLSSKADTQWVAMGAAIVLLALVEHIGRRRPTTVGVVGGLAVAASAFLVTLDEPAPTAVGFAVLTGWGLWRHRMPVVWLPASDDFGVVPAFAATVAAAALWDLTARGPALIVTAAIVFLLAIAGQLWRLISDDLLWRWFVPSSAVAVTGVSMALPWGDLPIEVAVASALVTGAILLSAMPIAVRAWTTSAVLLWLFANAAEALDIARNALAITLAAAALALLVGSLVAARSVCVHLAMIAHVVGLSALAVPTWPGWAAASVVGAATAGWWTTTIFDERGAAVHLAALRRRADRKSAAAPEALRLVASRWISDFAPLSSLLGLWATVFLAVDATGWVTRRDPWAAAISGAVILGAAFVVRMVHWRRANHLVLARATLIAVVATALAAISTAGSDREHWSPVVCLALGLAVVSVTAAPRPPVFTWTAYVSGAALTVFVADRIGLDRDWTDVALSGWGGAVLLGGLALQRLRHGPLALGTFVRDRLLLPPIVLGGGAFVIGGLSGLSDGTGIGIGWTAACMSAVVLAGAILLPLGMLAAPAEALATAAYILLAPWEPLDRPWTFGPWALILLGASLVTRRSDGQWPSRWDLPSFAVAHGVAGVALIAAIESETIVATYAEFGALAVAVAVVLRRWQWAAAGAVFLLVAGLDAGPGWLAAVLFIEGVSVTIAGLLRTRLVRWMLLTVGAGAIIGAWFEVAAWQSWAVSTVFYATVPAAAAITLLAAMALRSVRVPRELASVWVIAGSLLVLGTAGVGVDEVARRPGGLILAGSLLVLAFSAGLIVVEVGGEMRWVAAAIAAVAWVPAAWGLGTSTTIEMLVGTAVALAGLMAALVVHGRRPDAAWLYPGALYASATQLGAATAALDELPERDLLIVVLLALSAELMAFGVLSQRSELYVLSPIPACGAWLLYASYALAGEANWFTVPIGLTLLMMVGLVRWIRRGRGGDPATYDVIALEFVGMSFLVASPLARTLAGHLWNGVLAIGIGILITGWAVVTRVRWRAGFGAVSVVLATVLLIGVPLSNSVTWRGPTLWVTLSAIGVIAIVVASALERGRDKVEHMVQRIDQLTAGWERFPPSQDRFK